MADSNEENIDSELKSSEQKESEGALDSKMIAEDRAERIRRAEERIKQRKLEIQEEEKKRDIDREKARRKEGQDLVKIKSEMEWREAQKLAEERKREKKEDRLARQKIKEQIAEDRANMRRKRQEDEIKKESSTSVQTVKEQVKVGKEYKEAKLQIRLPNNTQLIQSFGVDEPLSAVRLYVEMNSGGELGSCPKLSTTFPRKVFNEDDMQAPLRSLDLVPTAVLQATRGDL